MEQAHGPDITFTVHPRPKVDDPNGFADPVSLPSGSALAPSLGAAEDTSHIKDTLLSELIFLARFAFGRY